MDKDCRKITEIELFQKITLFCQLADVEKINKHLDYLSYEKMLKSHIQI